PRDDFSALRCAAGAGHALIQITVDHGVVDRQLGTRWNIPHGDERNLPPHPDVWVTGVVEAQDVGFNLLDAAWRNIETILDLNLCGRQRLADVREGGSVHDGSPLDGDDFALRDRLTREEPTTLDGADTFLGFGIEPATHRQTSWQAYMRITLRFTCCWKPERRRNVAGSGQVQAVVSR